MTVLRGSGVVAAPTPAASQPEKLSGHGSGTGLCLGASG